MFAHPEGADVPGALAGAPNQPASGPAGRPADLARRPPPAAAAAGRRARRRHRRGLRRARGGGGAAWRVAEEARRRGRAAAAAPAPLYTFALPVSSEREADAWLRAGGRPPWAPRPPGCCAGCAAPASSARPASCATSLAAHGGAGVTDAVLVLPSRVPAGGPRRAGRGDPARGPAAAAPAPAGARARPSAQPGGPARRARTPRAGSPTTPAAVDDDGAWTLRRAVGAPRRAPPAPCARPGCVAATGWPWPCATAARGSRRSSAPRGSARCRCRSTRRPAAERLAGILDDCEPARPGGASREAAGPGVAAAGRSRRRSTTACPGRCGRSTPRTSRYLIYSSGIDGPAQGRDARAPDLRAGHRDLRPRGAGPDPGRPLPLDGAAVHLARLRQRLLPRPRPRRDGGPLGRNACPRRARCSAPWSATG